MLSTNHFYFQLISEISTTLSPSYLIKIDQIFNTLKNSNFTHKQIKQAEQNLSLNLSKILNTKVIFTHRLCKNAMVLFNYNFLSSNSLSPKGLLKDQDKLLYVNDIQMYFDLNFFLNDLDFTPQELTAIILHEIGHLVLHNQFSIRFFNSFMQVYNNFGPLLNFFTLLINIFKNSLSFFILSLFLMFIHSRTLSFFDHLQEYNCDKFAIKYGYGDEIISALSKVNQIKLNKINSSLLEKTKRILIKIFNLNSHPEYEDRILTVAKDLKENYIHDYPDIKNELKKLLKNI